MSKAWLITGASRGLGRALAVAAAERGDRVLATARRPGLLADLESAFPDTVRAAALDVTDPAACVAAADAAVAALGRLDVVVNNAGYGLVGALEETGDAQVRRNFETNLFGPINMIRAALPALRAQRSGRIVNVSAIAGFSNEMGFAAYGAAKFALEGLSEALHGELRPLGIRVIIVEPGPFRTGFIARGLERAATRMPDYDGTSGRFLALLERIDGKQAGDPRRAAAAICAAVDSDTPPLRLVLGAYAYAKFRKKIEALTRELDEWEPTGAPTDFDPPPTAHP